MFCLDTGTGIPDEILDKVFEPFFTTKEVGKGSGLGLPQVLGVAKQLGGGVRIETRPGAGTTVNVYLPRAHERSDLHGGFGDVDDEPCPDTGATSVRKAMVLLVDDDNDVRAAAAGCFDTLATMSLRRQTGERRSTVLTGRGSDRSHDRGFVMPG